MDSPKSLLDTDILSAIMRQDARVLTNARNYLQEHDRLTISIITRYEILRGLKAKSAAIQISAFDTFCDLLEIVSLSDTIVVRAADIYADLRQRGMMIGDADILIAATAVEEGLTMVTNNSTHFSRIPSLAVVNWLVK